jgi:5-methylcytosine-specific restriction protein A
VKGLSNLKPGLPRLGHSMPGLPEPEPTWGQGRGGRPWRRTRARILERDKYLCQCEACRKANLLTPANEVDHIIPISQGGTGEDSNLRAINAQCHALKTALEAQAAERG